MNNIYKSPSGKYVLTITEKSTRPGCWNYTTGEVVDSNGKVIVTVNRNYSVFPYLFVESHPNGHDYLICGENYQGQTVIELDTGKRKDYLPEEAKNGYAFCWSSYEFNVASQLLVVSGCYWAAPYEYRFYDFSDPMNGWPELETSEYIDAQEAKRPEICGNIIQTFELEQNDEIDDDTKEIGSTKTFRREGNKLILLKEVVSVKEQEARQKRKEEEEKWHDKMKLFKETDPLYLTYQEKLKEWPSADNWPGIGQCYENWCPFFHTKESRWCHRIHSGQGWTIDLEWAMYTGPVKLVIYKDGHKFEEKFFAEHSVESIELAFDYARSLIQP